MIKVKKYRDKLRLETKSELNVSNRERDKVVQEKGKTKKQPAFKINEM